MDKNESRYEIFPNITDVYEIIILQDIQSPASQSCLTIGQVNFLNVATLPKQFITQRCFIFIASFYLQQIQLHIIFYHRLLVLENFQVLQAILLELLGSKATELFPFSPFRK